MFVSLIITEFTLVREFVVSKRIWGQETEMENDFIDNREGKNAASKLNVMVLWK